MPKLKPNQFYLSGHLITERPLLFQTEMVQANLEERKTQTRRTQGLGHFNVEPDFWCRKNNPMMSSNRLWNSTKEVNPNPLSISFGFRDPIGCLEYKKSIYGMPGDLLWVRETWGKWGEDYYYRASTVPGTEVCKWKPSIHMPKAASRLWLMVEDIRVEQVQDISEKDAKAEGVSSSFPMRDMKYAAGSNFIFPKPFQEHQMSFLVLWCKINGAESWDANPWVWVVQYRILSKTGRPSDDTILENYLQITGKVKEVSHE